MAETQFPTLYKKTAGGRVQQWTIAVAPGPEGPDGPATIATTFGLVGGKQQTQFDVIRAGKNLGRRNATTPFAQAVKEAAARHRKQIERDHYGTDPDGGESAAKRQAAPMLAQSYWSWDKAAGLWVRSTHARKVDWSAAPLGQPKLDGHRLLAVRADGPGTAVRFYSRKGEDVTVALPHLAAAVTRLPAPGPLALDGELYRHGTPVTSIGGWVRKRAPEARELEYHVYDLARPGVRFVERAASLAAALAGVGALESPLVPVASTPLAHEEALLEYQARCLEDGFEGAMLRLPDAPYEAGKRSSGLLKVKSFAEAEFPIVGVREGRGTLAGAAVLRCVTEAGHEFEVTAPGPLEQKRALFVAGDALAGRRLTVRFAGYTSTETPVPFHPVARQLREDL